MTQSPPTPPRRAAIRIDDGAIEASDKTTDPLDLGGFAPKGPKTGPKAEAIRHISEQADFHSREAQPEAVPATGRPRRRRRSNRVIQFNVKLTPETVDQISDIADDQNWTYAELVEQAVAALEEKLGAGR